MSLISKIWDAIKSFFSGSEIQAIGSKANDLVNALKKVDESTVGQFVETTVATIYPPASGILDAIHIALKQAVIDLGLVSKDMAGKSNGEVLLGAVATLNDLKAADPTLYSGTLQTLSQKIQTIEAGATGVLLSDDQAAVNAVISHNPNVVETN